MRGPRIGEERRGKAAKRPCIIKLVSAPGAFLFGYFLLGKAAERPCISTEKYLAARAREPASNNNRACKALHNERLERNSRSHVNRFLYVCLSGRRIDFYTHQAG